MEQSLARDTKVPMRSALIVLTIAIMANSLVLMATNPRAAGDGDGPFYISIARNLAAGNGYVLTDSFWPDKPTMGRAPVWPLLLSLPALIAPRADDYTLLRVTAACLNVANALFLFGIAWMLSRDRRISTATG